MKDDKAPVKLLGGKQADTLEGGKGDDTILLRWGNDTAEGNKGADNFILDGRYTNKGDAYEILDLNFKEGDTITFRLFDKDSFSNNVDPSNNLQILGKFNNGAIIDSLEDIREAHLAGALTASAVGKNDTLLTLNVDGKDISLLLHGVKFKDLNLTGKDSVDLSPGDDTLIGGSNNDDLRGWGGNDTIIMRWGNDTATGGDGADQFVFDGRYTNNGDSHTILDLDFSEGDSLLFQFTQPGPYDQTFELFSIADIVDADSNGLLAATGNGNGGTDLTLDIAGNTMVITLDDIVLI